MKNQLEIVLRTTLVILLIATAFTLIACNSQETPLPEKYTGTYGSGQYGNLYITKTQVYTDQLLLPQCILDGTMISWEIVRWDPVSFEYFSDMTFKFDAYVESITSDITGTTSFSGTFAENTSTYDIHFKYYGNKEIWFAKNK